MSKNTFYLICITLSCCYCLGHKKHSKAIYRFRPYTEIGKIFDSITPPYIVDVSFQNKRVVFIGCEHQADSNHAQFDSLKRLFYDLKPQISFNEGGQIPDTLHYTTYDKAIAEDGETGALKYLSDQAGIKMMNGDIVDSLEFLSTFKEVPKDKMLLYYTMERIIIPQLNHAYGYESMKTIYERLIKKWFVKNGVPLDSTQQTFNYFTDLYHFQTGEVFDTANVNVELFDYVNDDCEFCAIGRISKIARDSTLVSKIQQALLHYDRILVTFGHGHAMAVEPALKQLFK